MLRLKATLVSILEAAKNAPSARAEAEQILFHVLRLERPDLKSIQELKIHTFQIPAETEALAIRLAYSRAGGKPLQHVLGYQFFYEHEYEVNESTLIPRQETEILVDTVIAWTKIFFGDQIFRMAELGIGSGVISGEILSHFKHARAYVSELNPQAIELALQNLGRVLGPQFLERITLIQSGHARTGFEIFQPNGPFDLIISNPPYLSKQDEIEPDVLNHEPHPALFPKSDQAHEQPNYFYENFLLNAKELLKPKGAAFFEIPHERANHLETLFRAAGFSQVTLIPDLTGRPRVLQATF
jgi:release factor glutamine methyltransferase